jgi:hypothetical protein
LVGWDERAYHVRVRHVGLCLLVPLRCCEVAWKFELVYCFALSYNQVDSCVCIPTTSVSFGSSSKKHFCEGPSM